MFPLSQARLKAAVALVASSAMLAGSGIAVAADGSTSRHSTDSSQSEALPVSQGFVTGTDMPYATDITTDYVWSQQEHFGSVLFSLISPDKGLKVVPVWLSRVGDRATSPVYHKVSDDDAAEPLKVGVPKGTYRIGVMHCGYIFEELDSVTIDENQREVVVQLDNTKHACGTVEVYPTFTEHKGYVPYVRLSTEGDRRFAYAGETWPLFGSLLNASQEDRDKKIFRGTFKNVTKISVDTLSSSPSSYYAVSTTENDPHERYARALYEYNSNPYCDVVLPQPVVVATGETKRIDISIEDTCASPKLNGFNILPTPRVGSTARLEAPGLDQMDPNYSVTWYLWEPAEKYEDHRPVKFREFPHLDEDDYDAQARKRLTSPVLPPQSAGRYLVAEIFYYQDNKNSALMTTEPVCIVNDVTTSCPKLPLPSGEDDAQANPYVPEGPQSNLSQSKPTQPGAPQSAQDSPRVAASVKHLVQGQAITFTAAGFLPGEAVSFEVHSRPLKVGTGIADASGIASITWTAPADFKVGQHKVIATGMTSAKSSVDTFTVSAMQAPLPHTDGAPTATTSDEKSKGTVPTQTTISPKSHSLARTGESTTGTIALLGMLLGAGSLMLLRRKR